MIGLLQPEKYSRMHDNPTAGIITFWSMHVLNIGILTHGYPIAFKVIFTTLSACVTVMAAANQWYTFQKNYKTYRIVIIIEHVIKFIIPKGRAKKSKTHFPPKNKYP